MQIIERREYSEAYLYTLAAEAIRKGKVIIFPTDTIYGIIADATNKKACRKIFEVKHRPAGKSFPVLIGEKAEASRYAKLNPKQKKIMGSVWPGPVTCVVEYKRGLAKEATAKDKIGVSVGLRLPKEKKILALLKAVRKPLAATSANRSGKPYHGNPKAIARIFSKSKPSPAYYFDFGVLPTKKPSKVIDIRGSKPETLRK
jgi:L-threonylcarbamoyladenylate synthase